MLTVKIIKYLILKLSILEKQAILLTPVSPHTHANLKWRNSNLNTKYSFVNVLALLEI